MEFLCNREEFVSAVVTAQKAASTKSPVPILQGIYIYTADDAVVVYCTDNEIGIEAKIGATVKQEGSIVVNARLFSEIIRNLPGEEIHLSSRDDVKIKVSSENAEYDLFILQAGVYPSFPEVNRENEYRIRQMTLKQMFTQTSFAIGVDDTRKPLTGLFLESENGVLTVVAVDGFRIALRRQTVEDNNAQMHMIIPAKTINELIKIIPSTDGELSLYGNLNQTIAEFENCRLFTRIIDGEFFNYKYIVPNDYITQIILRRGFLQEAVERAALILNSEQVRRYPVILNVHDDLLTVRALSDLGNVEEEIALEKMEGEDIEVAFNPRFLIEALRAIEDETVAVRFSSKVGQCVIKPVNEDESYTYLILPVRIEG